MSLTTAPAPAELKKREIEHDIIVVDKYGVRRTAFVKGEIVDDYHYYAVVTNERVIGATLETKMLGSEVVEFITESEPEVTKVVDEDESVDVIEPITEAVVDTTKKAKVKKNAKTS